MQRLFANEEQLARIASALLGSSILLLGAVVVFGLSVLGQDTLQIVGASVLLALYGVSAYCLSTIGRYTSLRRLRIWQASLALHAVIAVAAGGLLQDIRVLGLLFPEGLSALLHLVGIHLASKALRAA